MTFENTNCKLKVRSHPSFGHLAFNTGRGGSRGPHHSSMKMWNTFGVVVSTVCKVYITTYW